jgi:metallo-beta-lactamase family protein
VNHGDPESSKGFARLLNDQYQLNASAPCSGSVFDMTRGEWIRLTDPVICRKPVSQDASAKKQDRKKNTAYEDFRNTLDRFLAYADTLRGVSNSELRKMTETIRKLME